MPSNHFLLYAHIYYLNFTGSGDMLQQLRTHVALVKGMSSIPSIHRVGSRPSVNLVPGAPTGMQVAHIHAYR